MLAGHQIGVSAAGGGAVLSLRGRDRLFEVAHEKGTPKDWCENLLDRQEKQASLEMANDFVPGSESERSCGGGRSACSLDLVEMQAVKGVDGGSKRVVVA